VFGQLGDFFGRRRLLFVALAIFFTGCAGCALAPNLPSLIIARIIQGFGGGALLTLTQALIGETVPPRERGKFQAWIAGAYGFASAFGPVAGGFITQAFGWRWIFWFLLPLPLVCAYIARRLPDIVPDHAGRRWRFDWLGLALFVLTMGAALVALDRARRFDAAYLPLILGLVALALFAGVTLLRVERRQPQPLLPLPLFAEASIWRLLTLSILVVAAQVGLISFLPLWLQVVRGMEPANAGLVLLPIAIGSSFGAFFSGKMVARTGHAMLWPSIGLPVAAMIWSLLAFFAPAMPLWLMLALLGVATFGSGTSYPVVQTTVQAAAGQGRLGIAAAGVAWGGCGGGSDLWRHGAFHSGADRWFCRAGYGSRRFGRAFGRRWCDAAPRCLSRALPWAIHHRRRADGRGFRHGLARAAAPLLILCRTGEARQAGVVFKDCSHGRYRPTQTSLCPYTQPALAGRCQAGFLFWRDRARQCG
jgi:MFS family permease